MAIFATKKFTASTSKKGLRVTPKASTSGTKRATARSAKTSRGAKKR